MNGTKMVMLGTLIAGFSLCSFNADCENGDGTGSGNENKRNKKEFKQNKNRKSFGKSHGYKKMMKQLNLNEEQKTKIKEITEANRETLKVLMTKMQENRKKLHEATAAENVDNAAISAITQDIAKNMTERAMLKSKIGKEINSILTEEQKVQAKELKKNMKEEMKKHMRKNKSQKNNEFSQQMKRRRKGK